MPERPTAAPATLDQTTKRTLDSAPVTEQEKKSWLDLSITQVLGGALAAMTAAALGSRFSLAGTVTGAALASVIAAVAGALYTASLRRTRETVRAVIGGRPTAATVLDSSSDPEQSTLGNSAAVPLEGVVDGSARASRRRTLVVRSLVGAGAIFVLAAGALTTYEVLSGHALSGGDGTTFSQVQERGPEDRPTDEPAPTPSESADPSATAEPSDEPSVTPEAEPSPTAEPSTEPTAEPSVTPQAEPSATTGPPSPVPSQATPR